MCDSSPRSALEGADVGFVVFRAVRHGDAVDWEVVDANSFVRERWILGGETANGTRMSTHADEITRSAIGPMLEAALGVGAARSRPTTSPGAVGRERLAPGDRRPRRRRHRRDHHVRHRRPRRRPRARGRPVAAQLRHRRDHRAPTVGSSWVSPAVEAMLGYPADDAGRAVHGRPRTPRRRRRRSSSGSSRSPTTRRSYRRSSCGCSGPTATTSGSSARSRTASTIPMCAASC